MQLQELYAKALRFEDLSKEEGVFLHQNAPLSELMYVGNELRKKQVPHGRVTWIIDRNMNTTNVCVANCKFCNFYRIPGHAEAYITDIETYKQKIGGEVAQIGVLMEAGEITDLLPLKKLIERVGESISYTEEYVHCTTDIDTLLKDASDENRWLFNLRALRNRVPGVGQGELCILFARPNTGKTAFHISLCYGPGGFLEQGAKVHTLVNEEPSKRSMLRAISSSTGASFEEMQEDIEFSKNAWRDLKPKVNMFDAHGMSIDEIDSYCERYKPDVLVVDQLDKISVKGNFQRTDEKLREVYTQAREIAKRHDLAFIAICQASADAHGKTILDPTEMEGSKTGKFAEADLIIGVGCHAVGVNEEADTTRHLTVGKNKITGWHGTIVCLIEPQVSRYVD